MASWYGPPYAGRKGADGKVYDQNAMTAAHLTLPLGTMVRVTNLTNNESVVVRITDRGPFVHGRIIDLSLAAAKATGVYRAGVAKVRVEAYAAPARVNADPGGHWCVQVGALRAHCAWGGRSHAFLTCRGRDKLHGPSRWSGSSFADQREAHNRFI
jgi:rare lipoprotein A